MWLAVGAQTCCAQYDVEGIIEWLLGDERRAGRERFTAELAIITIAGLK
jgi:hypothetical protein